ncbi:MarR family transcriptional regulator [Acinetobacter cumulans]|uniref:MarR family transcriptional regulator n=1 Tax=Acinetobacter cumulans TaxID=2136182 RepID=A0A498D5J8_9GAMM|nr:MarR family transcriptional regulator [Acinetobacter cumulans]RKG50478.1 MarR family transcriptional regulator [Acinetobacter cumulans]RLL32612.1 MarR family transcriptional regulator [Acinetobacter cumulans]RLL43211.1 MarR family transcriptional regulator [Acinetobacter cumulans]
MRSSRMICDEINTLLLPYQLNYSLWQVMFVIHEKQSCTSIDIANYLNVSKPSITKRTLILSQLGILTQLATQDKRQKKIALSDAGLQLYQTCANVINDFEQSMIQQFDQKDVVLSTALLNTLIDQLSAKKSGNNHA